MNQKKLLNKNENGITLIALVITIIVLLLLAGVAISMLSGENGILKQAANAKTKTEKAAQQEEESLDQMELLLGSQKTPWKDEVAEGFAGGEGTEESPYLIENGSQLAYLAQQVNNGETYENKYIELIQDIDLEYRKWTPIGLGTEDANTESEICFDGIFNGNGYYINNINIQEPKIYGVGLFGITGKESIVQNIKTSKGRIIGKTLVGGIVGYSQGKIKNCINNTNIIAQDDDSSFSGELAGGIVGQIDDSTIIECINYGDVMTKNDKGKTGRGKRAGGIAASAINCNMSKCTNYGEIISMYQVAGGIVASTEGSTIENCVNEGKVTAKYNKSLSASGQYVGGIAGWISNSYFDNCTIKSCINRGEILAEKDVAGGIVGAMDVGEVIDCTNIGIVISQYIENVADSGIISGGIIGLQKSGLISNCNNKGEIIAEVSIAAGIAGRSKGTVSYCSNEGKIKQLSKTKGDETFSYKVGGISGDNMGGTIEYCYNIGSIESLDAESIIDEVGGIAGLNRNSGTVRYCYNKGVLTGGNAIGGVIGQLYDGTLEKNYYYVVGINTAIGHNGTSYTELTAGSDVTGQAEVITESEAKTITNFDKFKEWIKTK